MNLDLQISEMFRKFPSETIKILTEHMQTTDASLLYEFVEVQNPDNSEFKQVPVYTVTGKMAKTRSSLTSQVQRTEQTCPSVR